MSHDLIEYGAHDGTPYPADWESARRQPLAAVLAALEAQTGPLEIVSAYRPASYNRAIGGAEHSQHVAGRALDVRAATATPSEIKSVLDELITSGAVPQIHGVGLYPGWLHFDVRPGTRVARWTNYLKTAPESETDSDQWVTPLALLGGTAVLLGAYLYWR